MQLTQPLSTSQHRATSSSQVDRAIADLQVGARRLSAASLEERIQWAVACVNSTSQVAHEWVESACAAKRIPPTSPARAEEILAGPAAVVRYLQLITATLRSLQAGFSPQLRGKPRVVRGQVRVPTFPTREFYDAVTLSALKAETWLEPSVTPDAIFGDATARLRRQISPTPHICLVLGAGNVAAIPFTDVLTCILQNDHAVLLKMNPVNDYVGPIVEHALQPLIAAGLLRVIYGDSEVGRYAIQHPLVDSIHITGSNGTHDAIVWGHDPAERRRRQHACEPLLTKPVTSELGNVTPWAIVPGDFSDRQLAFQAQNIATSIANNASFNCIATKMLITWKAWPAREKFLNLIAATLEKIPPRYAYYPGAIDRYSEFSGGAGGPDEHGRLPWLLRRNVDPDREPHLFARESFVCVAGEIALEASSPQKFLARAVDFMNSCMWGTLAAALTVPNAMRKHDAAALDDALFNLRYSTIGINQWPGVAYALMSTPWGGYPGATLTDIQSGRGHVHNTYLLDKPQKTIVFSPLTIFPKPLWFSTHRQPEPAAWRLFELYRSPTPKTLLGLIVRSLI